MKKKKKILVTAADQPTAEVVVVVVGQLTVKPFSIGLLSERNDGIDTLTGCIFTSKRTLFLNNI